MSSAFNLPDTPRAVEAELKFAAPNTRRPRVFKPTPEFPEGQQLGAYETQIVSIADARPDADSFRLDREGFELRRHRLGAIDFFDDEQVRSIYYPEMERLVRAASGASRVVVFDHTIRLDDPIDADAKGARTPVQTAHNDYTPKSAEQRLRDLLGAEEAERWSAHRYALVNVWRSIAGPVETTPLALADARSLSPEAWIATDLVYADRVGEIFHAAYDPTQRWHYFSKMTRDEALLLKVYDSAGDRARWTAHAAFAHPEAPPDAAPRQSIEIRTLVSFAPVNVVNKATRGATG